MKKISDKVSTAFNDYKALRRELNENLIVNGKTLREWHATFFSLQIPEDADPIVCKQLSLKVMRLNILASSFYIMSNARLNSIQSSSDWIYREKYKELVDQYRANDAKMPAAAFLETMSKQDSDDVRAIVMVAEVEKNFWKEMLNYITRMRKQLENITMNNALMYKAEGFAGAPGGGVNPFDEGSEMSEGDDDDVPDIF